MRNPRKNLNRKDGQERTRKNVKEDYPRERGFIGVTGGPGDRGSQAGKVHARHGVGQHAG